LSVLKSCDYWDRDWNCDYIAPSKKSSAGFKALFFCSAFVLRCYTLLHKLPVMSSCF